MLKKLAMLFGVVFVAVGLLGFVPGVTDDKDMLLGIFQVDGLHNVIHLLSGLAALLATKSEDMAQMYFRLFGAVYALVAVVGFVQGDTVLGLLDVNMADNLLHTALAVALLGVGFGVAKSGAAKPAAAPSA